MEPLDIPRHFSIRERSHRVLNPVDETKLATLGRALPLEGGTTVLDLACGKGELLCTWARDHGKTGTGVDASPDFLAAAHARAAELDVEGSVRFVHADASGYVADEPVDLVSCLGATWIGGGVVGTLELMRRSLRAGGTLLVGEPFWNEEPPSQEAVEGSHVARREDSCCCPSWSRRSGPRATTWSRWCWPTATAGTATKRRTG
ncbi:hypothetical protein GCM10027446_06780 [Angustibacter peucedani]